MTHYTPEVLSSAAEFYESQPTGQYDDEAAHALRCHHELLKALKDLLHAFPGEYTKAPAHITAARAAIAKATGEK